MVSETQNMNPQTLSREQRIALFRTIYAARRIDDREIAGKRQNKVYFQINGVGHEAIGAAASNDSGVAMWRRRAGVASVIEDSSITSRSNVCTVPIGAASRRRRNEASMSDRRNEPQLQQRTSPCRHVSPHFGHASMSPSTAREMSL